MSAKNTERRSPAAPAPAPAKQNPKAQPDDAEPLGHETTIEAIEGVVERQLDPVLQNLSRVQREQVISKVVGVVRREVYSGPLPHPRHLEQFDAILPGGAERIFRMSEQTLEHNLDSMKKAQKNDHGYRLLGMWLGFAALILLVLTAVYAGMNDNNILAGLLLGTGVLSTIGVFVSAHLKKDE